MTPQLKISELSPFSKHFGLKAKVLARHDLRQVRNKTTGQSFDFASAALGDPSGSIKVVSFHKAAAVMTQVLQTDKVRFFLQQNKQKQKQKQNKHKHKQLRPTTFWDCKPPRAHNQDVLGNWNWCGAMRPPVRRYVSCNK
jgi:hypothetical protein